MYIKERLLQLLTF